MPLAVATMAPTPTARGIATVSPVGQVSKYAASAMRPPAVMSSARTQSLPTAEARNAYGLAPTSIPSRDNSQSFSSMVSARAVLARDYVPDSSDELDLELAQHLQELNPHFASKLRLFRKGPSSYEIEGRHVSLRWADEDDEDDGLILVQEAGIIDPEMFTPLDTYLQQTAHVATFVNENCLQHNKELTFGDARIPSETDPFTARLMCMKLACEQAERRQVQPINERAASFKNVHLPDEPIEKEQQPKSWWEFFTDFGRRNDDRLQDDDDASEEEGCY